ncbi:MAG: hypothetical protein RLZZ346_596 [Cyanobacteriota bacterium]
MPQRWLSTRENQGPCRVIVGSSVVVVLAERKRLRQLQEQLAALTPPPQRLVAIGAGETDVATVAELNPALTRQLRQRRMATWLIPFGFFAGLTFTFITDLDTFAFAGPIGSHLIGGLLGLGSGWMGSFAAAASVSAEGDDRVRALRNRLEEGNWLLLVESASGMEIPWTRLQEVKPKAVVRLSDS